MLTLRSSLDDWDLDPASFNELPGNTSLQVFSNRAIISSSGKVRDGYEIWAGEDVDPFQMLNDVEARISSTRDFDLFDGLRISITRKSNVNYIVLARTIGGTSPIYLAVNGPKFHISWKFEEAVAVLERPQPNRELCRLVLERGVGQTREQIIAGVYAIWPGEKAVFGKDGLQFSPCENIRIALAASLSDRGYATDAFLDLIISVVQPMLTRSKRPLLEFSGGIDSTCVALAAAKGRGSLESYGLIQPGAVGRQQRARREELIELLALTDYTGPAERVLPLDTLMSDECQITVYDDSYRMSMLSIFAEHGLEDVDLVISGLGGDELAMERTFWRHDGEMPGYSSRSALISSMSNFDMFMRRGIWPLNPLAHPRVVSFCRMLPDPLRKDRLFARLAMARSGLSDGYIFPRYKETFANVLYLQALECDVDQLLETSILGDYGIFDVSRLLSKTHKSTELGPSIKLIGRLYYTCKLESVLKRYVK